jgi:hypothetical protein
MKSESKPESKIAEAVGTATVGKIREGNPVETAMRNAVTDTYRDAERVWERDDIDEDEKRKMVADIISDENIKNKTLEARAKARKILRQYS